MRPKLGTRNHCAVPFLGRAGANLCWYYYTTIKDLHFGFRHFADCIMEDKIFVRKCLFDIISRVLLPSLTASSS